MSKSEPNTELDKPDLKLVRALQKDFEKLYVKEFTTAWKENRFIRNIELGVMRLENLQALIDKQVIEARIDELEKLTANKKVEGSVINYGAWQTIEERLTQLRTTK